MNVFEIYNRFIVEISQIISETSIQQKDLFFYMKVSKT